jgi:hypothetical protein
MWTVWQQQQQCGVHLPPVLRLPRPILPAPAEPCAIATGRLAEPMPEGK